MLFLFQVKIGGEWKCETRLVAWYGPCDYSYSGLHLDKNLNWAPELLDLLHRLNAITRHEFNSVFCNLYRYKCDDSVFQPRLFHQSYSFTDMVMICVDGTPMFILNLAVIHPWPRSRWAWFECLSCVRRQVPPTLSASHSSPAHCW